MNSNKNTSGRLITKKRYEIKNLKHLHTQNNEWMFNDTTA